MGERKKWTPFFSFISIKQAPIWSLEKIDPVVDLRGVLPISGPCLFPQRVGPCRRTTRDVGRRSEREKGGRKRRRQNRKKNEGGKEKRKIKNIKKIYSKRRDERALLERQRPTVYELVFFKIVCGG